jgi:hypothetical protein
MHLVNKPACSDSHLFAQEQQAFVCHTLKLIIGVFKLISEFKNSKVDHSKDYITSKNFHVPLNYFSVIKISLTYSIYILNYISRFTKYSNSYPINSIPEKMF